MNKKELYQELKKALHRCIAKAYKNGNSIVAKALDGMPDREKSLKAIMLDIEDPDMIAETPEKYVRIDSQNVLHKQYEAGVYVSKNPKKPGRSIMGGLVELGAFEEAKREAKRVIKEQKKMKKPKIYKCEHCGNINNIEKADEQRFISQDGEVRENKIKETQDKDMAGSNAKEKQPTKVTAYHSNYGNSDQVFLSERQERGIDRLRKFLSKREK